MKRSKKPSHIAFTKKRTRASRALQGSSYMFASFGYWDEKIGRQVAYQRIVARPTRHLFKNGRA